MKDVKQLMDELRAVSCSEPVLGGSFYKVMSQQFKLPNGDVVTREFLRKKPAAIVVPITNEGNVVCVVQTTALVKEGVLLELPAGYAEPDENIAKAAMRELLEETGYVAEEIFCLGSHYQDPGSIKEPVQVFAALRCKKVQKQNLDVDEHVGFIEIPYNELMNMLDNGEIKDANTYIALSKWERYNR